MPHLGHFYFEEYGSGRPLLLLHGHTLDHRMWHPMLAHLGSGYRVIMPDLPDHGRSGPTPEGRTAGDDLAQFVRALGTGPLAVCGFCMGGAYAINLALSHPGLCSALITVGSALDSCRFTSWRGPKFYMQKARSEGLQSALAAWLSDPVFAPALASPAANLVREMVEAFPGRSWLRRESRCRDHAVHDLHRLGDITMPTLVMVGENDLVDFLRVADILTAAIPQAHRTVIPEVGHLVPLERPDLFAHVLRTFLDQVYRRPF